MRRSATREELVDRAEFGLRAAVDDKPRGDSSGYRPLFEGRA